MDDTTKPRWTDYISLEDLPDDEANPKGHAADDIDASITRFAFTEPALMDERTGKLAAGHGRKASLLRLEARGDDPPEGVLLSPTGRWMVPVTRGWSSRDDDEARAYLVTSNRLTELGGWNDRALADILGPLSQLPDGLTGVGYTAPEVQALLDSLDTDTDPAASTGSLLALTDVTWEEPTHQPETGDVWLIDSRHYLCVLDVMADHGLWTPYLTGPALFVPYPGPYVALTKRAADTPFVMVQPDAYLAGHILDKFAAVHGIDKLAKIA